MKSISRRPRRSPRSDVRSRCAYCSRLPIRVWISRTWAVNAISEKARPMVSSSSSSQAITSSSRRHAGASGGQLQADLREIDIDLARLAQHVGQEVHADMSDDFDDIG